MSYNGSGTFVINTAGQPVVSGTVISSTAFNALTADLATGLSTAITKDGQTTPTANIPMGNNKITGLAVGTAATDAANLSQVQSTTAKLINSISGTDTITGTMSPNLGAYATGQMFYFIAAGDNTGAVTLNIDSLGAKAVTRDGSVALAASDLKSGEVVVVVYDGTRFQVVSQLNSAGDARFANVSIASALNVGGVATFSAGTAAAPSITTSGDTNTGIFFPAADTIAFAEGGVEAARFNSSGDFGVGETSPDSRLEVAKAITFANIDTFPQLCIKPATGSTGNRLNIAVDNSSNIAFIQAVNRGVGDIPLVLQRYGGNLGLGVTPSTWSTGKAIQINNVQASIWGAGDQINVLSNAYFNSGYKYAASKAASMYEQALGVHSWFTAPSGTAGNAITFTQAMTLDASGNLLVGSTSSSAVANKNVDVNGTGDAAFTVRVGGTTYAYLYATASTALVGSPANIPFLFYTNGTARARITANGNFLVNTTAEHGVITAQTGGGGVNFAMSKGDGTRQIFCIADGYYGYQWAQTIYADGGKAFVFSNAAGTEVGTIVVNNASTAYNTTSDYRLKDEQKPLAGSGAFIDAIKPKEWIWKTNGERGVGFIAHELADVSPSSVSGEKDGMRLDKVKDENGEYVEKMVPNYQSVSYSSGELIANLIAEVQSLRKRVAELETK